MKIRIIKEESVYRIQEHREGGFFNTSGWIYALKSYRTYDGTESNKPKDFKTQKEAEDFIEHNYIVKVIKEYEVEDVT